MLPLLERIDTENGISIDKAMFFGNIYMNNPNLFKFSLGERIQISEIVAFVTKIVDSKNSAYGTQYFFELKNHQQNISTKVYPIIGRFFCNETLNSDNELDLSKNIDFNKVWETDLYDHITEIYYKCGIETDDFSGEIVSVDQERNGKLIGKTKCLLCMQNKKKKYEYNVPYKRQPKKLYWLTKNFVNHLKKCHNIVPGNQDLSKEHKRLIKLTNRMNKNSHDEKKTREKSQDIPCNYHSVQSLSIEDIAVVEEIDDSEQVIGEVNIDIEGLRSKIYNQISDQLLKMEEWSEMHNEILVNMEFICANVKQISQVGIIKRDGNCLFRALAHQIFGFKLDSDELEEHTKKMRAHAIQFILDNLSLFEMDITGSLSDKDMNDRNVSTACQNYIAQLSKEAYWGGAEIIRAISMIHKVNILIVNGDGGFYFPLEFQLNLEQTLIIAYKSNNHYDSMVHIDAPHIFQMVEEILSRYEVIQSDDFNIKLSNECIDGEFSINNKILLWEIIRIHIRFSDSQDVLLSSDYDQPRKNISPVNVR